MKQIKEKSAAILTIFSACTMSKQGKSKIAQWLRDEALHLINQGKSYSKKYVAWYMYVPRKNDDILK